MPSDINGQEFNAGNITDVELVNEMKSSYIQYAMSVIVSRALPDVRDGLKPVHRRILYTMYQAGYTPDKPYKKCAATVGDVLGKYHPHGDASVYDAMVRMAQDFSLRYPLIDGHGNFGSVDGDPPAAYRYTESRMSKISLETLSDIDKETVDFMDNYDGSLREPVVLPSRLPQLLINGSSGIAVGMATNIPPHNLTEVIDGTIAYIDNRDISIDELINYIKGPDFPTAGLIMGRSGIRAAYHTGRGKILMRSRAEIEGEDGQKQRIIVTEIPYQVNKARLIEKIAELVREKRLEGISGLRDESDRDGMRIVIEIKRDANANVVLNNLYKNTQMQESFGVIMLAIVDGQPKVLNLKEVIENYVLFQEDVIKRRTAYDLDKAKARAHILEGLLIAQDNIDEIIKIIRESYDDARERLMERFGLSEEQAKAILDMRLARLQGLEKEKIENEYSELLEKIRYYTDVLQNESMVLDIIKQELTVIKERYGDERRTEITNMVDDIDIEDLIEEEENVITLTHFGYVKRMPTSTYKSQRRGGRGITGLQTREEDYVETIFSSSTHNNILFFTNRGRMYRLKAYQLPEAGRQARGTAIINLLPIENGEKITAVIPLRTFEEGKFLFMCTRNGVIKKTNLMDYNTARKGGLNAIVLDEDDELIRVELSDGDNEIVVATHDGMAIRFNESNVRPMGRVTRGVKAISLREGDYVVGMCVPKEGGELLLVSENGFGKRTGLDAYRVQNRGGMGLRTYKITEQTGNVIGLSCVTDDDDILMITSEGIVIRIRAAEISTIGRNTKGVRLMRLSDDVKVVSIARTDRDDEEETEAVAETEAVEDEDSTEE
ncbi:MAG: DNA gyrase subunit A [Oscillospiraceae bacterium]|nr:DNA gyrase subunit A [Oscillospiraceae bacterium]